MPDLSGTAMGLENFIYVGIGILVLGGVLWQKISGRSR